MARWASEVAETWTGAWRLHRSRIVTRDAESWRRVPVLLAVVTGLPILPLLGGSLFHALSTPSAPPAIAALAACGACYALGNTLGMALRTRGPVLSRSGLQLVLAGPTGTGAVALHGLLGRAGPRAVAMWGLGIYIVAWTHGAAVALSHALALAVFGCAVGGLQVGALAGLAAARLRGRPRLADAAFVVLCLAGIGLLVAVGVASASGTPTGGFLAGVGWLGERLAAWLPPLAWLGAAAESPLPSLVHLSALATGGVAIVLGTLVVHRALAEDLLATADAARRAAVESSAVLPPTRVAVRAPRPFGRGATALVWAALIDGLSRRSIGLRVALGFVLGGVAIASGWVARTPYADPIVLEALTAGMAALGFLVPGVVLALPGVSGLAAMLARRSWLPRLPLSPSRALAALVAVPVAWSTLIGVAVSLPALAETRSRGVAIALAASGAWMSVVGLHVAGAACWLHDPPGAPDEWRGRLLGTVVSFGIPALALALAAGAAMRVGLPLEVACALAALPGLVAAGLGWPIAVRAFTRLEATPDRDRPRAADSPLA